MRESKHMEVQARGSIHLPQAQAFVEWLLKHWREEGVQVQPVGEDGLRLALVDVGSVELHVSKRRLHCTLEGVTPRMLELMQLSLAEHLAEYADSVGWPEDSWRVAWEGDTPRQHARLHVMQVLQSQRISPCMQRLRLGGNDVAALVQGGLHVRLLLPNRDSEPAWPMVLPDGRLQWQPGQQRMAKRTYTLRAVDTPQGWIEIDALLHGDAEPKNSADAVASNGPGAYWAAHAQVGSSVGVLAPAGGLLPQAHRCIVVADACALPAAARIVQAQEGGLPAQVLLWVADGREQAAWGLPEQQAQVSWLYGGLPGASQLEIAQVLQWLAQALSAVVSGSSFTGNAQSATLLWVAGGLPLTQAVRRWLSAQPPQEGMRVMVQTYWR